MVSIVAVEPVFADISHAPGNASYLTLLATAYPDAPITFLATPEHGAEVLARCAAFYGGVPPQLDHRRISPPPPSTEPVARFAWTLTQCRRAIAEQPPGPILLTLLYGDGPAMAAADLAAKLAGGGRVRTAYRLHGNLQEIVGWRSRNPLLRQIDMRGSLGRRRGPNDVVVVLEDFIGDALACEMPHLKDAIAVIPESVQEDGAVATPPSPPVTLGYLGLMTGAKGFDVYAALARELKPKAAGRLVFRVAGKLHPSMRAVDASAIDDPISTAPLDRGVFESRLKSLHYVCLPYQGDYYKWAASGVLLDAIGFGVPVIALKSPSTDRLFQRFGDCGHLCANVAEMRQVLENLCEAGLDMAGHRCQRDGMAQARQQRSWSNVLRMMKESLPPLA